MSITSEINRISGNVSDALDAVGDMGGTVPSGATSDNLATAIRSIPQSGGGGTSLPSVTSADNGKVLTVVSGDWDAAVREKDIFWVEGTEDLQNVSFSISNCSYGEIVAAYQAGKNVKIKLRVYMSASSYLETTGDLRIEASQFNFINFDALMVADLGYGQQLIHFLLRLESDDSTETVIRIVNTISS